AVAVLAAEPPHLLDHARRVGDRGGVGHGVHGGVAAAGGRAGAGLDGLGVLAAGLAQVGVEVDEAGQGDRAAAVDLLAVAREAGADLGDLAAVDADVDRFPPKDPYVTDDHAVSPPSSR